MWLFEHLVPFPEGLWSHWVWHFFKRQQFLHHWSRSRCCRMTRVATCFQFSWWRARWPARSNFQQLGEFLALGNFGILFSPKRVTYSIWQKVGWVTFWAIFFTVTSGHADGKHGRAWPGAKRSKAAAASSLKNTHDLQIQCREVMRNCRLRSFCSLDT
jgi:hypothetical protein